MRADDACKVTKSPDKSRISSVSRPKNLKLIRHISNIAVTIPVMISSISGEFHTIVRMVSHVASLATVTKLIVTLSVAKELATDFPIFGFWPHFLWPIHNTKEKAHCK